MLNALRAGTSSGSWLSVNEMRLLKKTRRMLLSAHRGLRSWRMIAKALVSTKHPLLAHIIPMRRCNLSCAYCNEYDDFSKPVPLEEMFRRIDLLGRSEEHTSELQSH